MAQQQNEQWGFRRTAPDTAQKRTSYKRTANLRQQIFDLLCAPLRSWQFLKKCDNLLEPHCAQLLRPDIKERGTNVYMKRLESAVLRQIGIPEPHNPWQ